MWLSAAICATLLAGCSPTIDHRGYVAVKGGAQDCPYTYMHDMAAGRYKLPWSVQVTDGSVCGFEPPTRSYKGPEAHPLVPDSAAVPMKKAA